MAAALAVLALLAGAIWLYRRNRPRTDDLAEAPAISAVAAPVGALDPPDAELAAAPPPPAAVQPAPTAPAAIPAPGFAQDTIAVGFAPRSLQLSLVYATLSYRLVLANPGALETSPVTIGGDLISSHVSLGRQWQLEPDERFVAPLHQLPGLAPGEQVTIDGELRLPLAEIVAVEAGPARFLAPLARFIVRCGPHASAHVLTFGEPPREAGGALVPLRLDTGPRSFRELVARPIDTARWLALDPVRRAS